MTAAADPWTVASYLVLEAIRDVQAEYAVQDEAEAARIVLAEGLDSWHRGTIPPDAWANVLDASEALLRGMVTARRESGRIDA